MPHNMLALTMVATVLSATVSADTWTLGAWNVENLGPSSSRGFPELRGPDSLPPRTDAQLAEIATYIRDELGADAMMLAEVVPDDSSASVPRAVQLDTIATRMGQDWEYFLGRTGRKRVAFLFDSSRVSVKKVAEFSVDEFTVQGKDIFLRDPLVVWMGALDAAGNEVDDLLLVGLHLKSVQQNR